MLLWVAVILLSIVCLLQFVALGVAGYYIIKFSRIILILEDDFSDAIEGLSDIEKAIEKLLNMQLFFDSKEVKLAVQEALSEVRAGRIAVNRLIQRFVERSKQKYIVVEEEADELIEEPINSASPHFQHPQNRGADPVLIPTRGRDGIRGL